MKMLKFVIAMILSFIPGFIGTFYTPGGGADMWYSQLVKTPLTPDGYVFGIVWPILYLILGFALYLVIKSNRKIINPATKLFGLHMILNALWGFLFFGQHLMIIGAITILALIIVAVMMQKRFATENKYAGLLVWPYITWLIFALYLNTGMIFLN